MGNHGKTNKRNQKSVVTDLSHDEYARIERQAERVNMTLSDLCRQAVEAGMMRKETREEISLRPLTFWVQPDYYNRIKSESALRGRPMRKQVGRWILDFLESMELAERAERRKAL